MTGVRRAQILVSFTAGRHDGATYNNRSLSFDVDITTDIRTYPEIVAEPFRIALGVVGPSDGRRSLSARIARPVPGDVTDPVAKLCNSDGLSAVMSCSVA